MRRLAVLASVTAVLAAVAAAPAGATNECKGLQVCVPITGPWVLTSGTAEVQYQLPCPKKFVVAGLDAELSTRGIEVSFRGALGSPVNPGITTTDRSRLPREARARHRPGRELQAPHRLRARLGRRPAAADLAARLPAREADAAGDDGDPGPRWAPIAT